MFPAGGGGGGGSEYFVQQQQLFHALGSIGMDAGAGAGAFTAGVGGGVEMAAVSETHCHALLYNLSVLKDKVQQLEPVVGVAVGHDDHGAVVSVSVAGAGVIIQEIITAASSMMYAFQQLYCVGVGLGLGAASTSVNNNKNAAAQEGGVVVVVGGHAKNGATTDDDVGHGAVGCSSSDQQAMDHSMQQWQHQHHHGGHGHSSYYIHSNSTDAAASSSQPTTATTADTIIELEAAELLARYTHYCQVCGKGFKRDANLRMHMRAHGDEYKSKAALANPTKSIAAAGEAAAAAAPPARRKYSCPQEGCRWNRKHAKFQPLKSVICAKNHYKRSHCPKMYVCNRCNRKHFSVVSDLRTHEKHCGDHHRWLCSCGTNFSRKDKLAGHVSLFPGHEPAVPLGAAGGGASRHGKRSLSSTTTTASQLGNCATTGFGMP